MICPRCTVAEIADSGSCALCGFSPEANVILKESVINEVQQVVERATGGRFRLQSLLRVGERSLVYLAHEVAHDRLVVLKVIPVTDGVSHALAQSFERRAAQYQSLRHAHVVTLHAFGAASTFLWYTLDHMAAPSLGDLLRERGPLSPDVCVSVADQVGSALDYAHRRGVAHANLKPSNIFVDDRWVRVSDFAILEALGRQGTSGAAASLRLPEYMAPEQFYARTAVVSADQYALAIIVYQCLTGAPPFIGDSFAEVARRQARDRATSLADVRQDIPLGMSEAVNRALSKQPAARFPSVLDFVTGLSAEQTPAVRPPAPRVRPTPRRTAPPNPAVLLIEPQPRSRLGRWLLALVALSAVGAGAAAVALRNRGEPVAQPFPLWAGPDITPAAPSDPVMPVPDSVLGAGRATGVVPSITWRPDPAATPPPPPVAGGRPNPLLVAVDVLMDSTLAAVKAYRERHTQFALGGIDCAALADALVNVETHWINYNVQRNPGLVLDAGRAARASSMYAQVDAVEALFDRSTCARP